MKDNSLLRALPQIDELLRSAELSSLDAPAHITAECARLVLDKIRQDYISGSIEAIPSTDEIKERIVLSLAQHRRLHLRPLINATGVVLHTNLGRAPMAVQAAKAAYDVAVNYSNLEYDLATGSRGSRHSHIEPLLTAITGAEAAMVVNNNAAAVLLILSALGKGKEAVISRGELVEIGGSFRIPEIMESCGCILKEVGTTNKTHISDYERALSENTFAIIKVHTSNYRIIGFSETPELSALTRLAHAKDLPLIEDLGSGALYPPEEFGVKAEPFPAESVAAGADIVSFSGDKLLGGPQAGIIVGRKKYIDILKKHPLARAMRVDKVTLAALEATLRIYSEKHPMSEIPTIGMIIESSENLRKRAGVLCSALQTYGIECKIFPSQGKVGGGSAPDTVLDGWAVVLTDSRLSANEVYNALQAREKPVIGRVNNNCLCLDVRTIFPEQLQETADALREVFA